MNKKLYKRICEIIPGLLSWSVIAVFITAVLTNMMIAALMLIVYLIYWACRLFYMTVLLVIAHIRMKARQNLDWHVLSKNIVSDKRYEDVTHIVLYAIYKEPDSVIESSLQSLVNVQFDRQKIIVVLAGEEREKNSELKLQRMKDKYLASFKDIVITIHPKDLPGEMPCKGANTTFAARAMKTYLEERDYDLSNVVLSCFDADTCPDKNYFSCLTFHYISNAHRERMSFQPLPIYNNNIFTAPAFARIIEIGSTFWQLIESMRDDEYVTFSSHSLSFKTLVDVGYWPVDLVSDDSLIFWKCFVHYDGDYATYPLEVPVYMDIAMGDGLVNTLVVQYKQKRRWAWGVETFVFLCMGFLDNKNIPLMTKLRKLWQILDNHINLATWAIIISFLTPLVLFWSRMVEQTMLIFFNLAYLNTVIFHALSLIFIMCMFISMEFLPPRPKGVSRFIYVSFMFQWLLTPFVSAILGSMPSLDAQTRLMLGKHLSFQATPKRRD